MFCPKCGCHAGPDGSRFCRNCGFRLDGVVQLLARNGAPDYSQYVNEAAKPLKTPRKEGLKKGGKVLFSSVAIFPLFFGLCFVFDSPGPLLVPTFVFFMGMMRMLYARLFEDAIPDSPNMLHPAAQPMAFAPTQPVSVVPSVYQPTLPPANVPTTGNLIEPPSITEQTTNLLNRSQKEI